MAKELSLENGFDDDVYLKYKILEKDAFEILFSPKSYKSWTLEQLYLETEKVVPLLAKKELNEVTNYLKQSLELREEYSLRFRYAPLQRQRGHDFWCHLIQRVIDLIDLVPANKQFSEFKGASISIDEAILFRFLDDIESWVVQAEALWRRVAAKEVPLSTASMLTNRYLSIIDSIVHTETILNSSMFNKDCLAAHNKGGSSTYWTELQTCAANICDEINNVVGPMCTSKMPFNYAPVLTQMLTKVKQVPGSFTVFNIPFVAIVAASLARRCNALGLNIETLRLSVIEQIVSTEAILKKQETVYEDHAMIKDVLLYMRYVTEWARNCCDAVSFGQMMGWLKVQYVFCIRLFIHDSSILQLFAYICERMRIDGEPLPSTLEAIFDDRRVNCFLFLDGRPKNLPECKQGIERWSDPSGMLGNLKLTQHIFSKRCKPTLTQQIFEEKGRVTGAMIKQIGNEPLEDYLNWELDPPDLISLEFIVISAVTEIMKKHSTKSKFKSKPELTVKIWSYLRNKVLYQQKMEKRLLRTFIKNYPPSFK